MKFDRTHPVEQDKEKAGARPGKGEGRRETEGNVADGEQATFRLGSFGMNASTPDPMHAPEHCSSPKEAQIVNAARNAFLQQGFSETSMEAIARAANVSKATLYAYFPSKEALFSYLIGHECEAKRILFTAPSFEDGIEGALRTMGMKFVIHFLIKDETAFFQAVSSERARFPELCRLYFNTGRERAVDFVAAFLEEAKATGALAFDDAHVAANQFLNLVLCDLPMRVALGLDLPNEAEAQKVMEAGVSTFLKAFQQRSQT
ncbi:TetR family transcriptional regulator [Methylocystis iwaonis]|uniref:TetR family transcriptional regulator n=2 Tax=Methylocystaceae TaxID=31993 RepID=A0ABM8E7I8_9HYPH|nr:TetR family transcriptional regulator [Methylocystis iwaonis]